MTPLAKRMSFHNARLAFACVLLCASVALLGCGADASSPARVPTLSLTGKHRDVGSLAGTSATASASPFRFFAPSSFWYRSAAGQLDPGSAPIVGALKGLVAEEESEKRGPWINTTEFSVPVYTVGAAQRTVKVQLDREREPMLQSAWDAVPLPASAKPAQGHDALLVIWQPSTDKLWEFWHLRHEADGWHATWGGAMRHVSSNPGVYGRGAWPGAKTWWGASASSLSLVGGLITLEDLKQGVINHAISMSIPNVRADVYSSPAQRGDGIDPSPLSLPEGAHLRLDPSLDLTSLHLPHLTLMMAEAAQRYGIYIRDGGHNITFQAQDPIPTGTEPYVGPGGYFEGRRPRELLAGFPWGHLELLKMELHRTRRSQDGPVRQLG